MFVDPSDRPLRTVCRGRSLLGSGLSNSPVKLAESRRVLGTHRTSEVVIRSELPHCDKNEVVSNEVLALSVQNGEEKE